MEFLLVFNSLLLGTSGTAKMEWGHYSLSSLLTVTKVSIPNTTNNCLGLWKINTSRETGERSQNTENWSIQAVRQWVSFLLILISSFLSCTRAKDSRPAGLTQQHHGHLTFWEKSASLATTLGDSPLWATTHGGNYRFFPSWFCKAGIRGSPCGGPEL